MVGMYSLTGSVSSSSGVMPPQLLSHELLISPWCHELKFPGSWNVVPQYHDGAPSYEDNRNWTVADGFQSCSQFTGSTL